MFIQTSLMKKIFLFYFCALSVTCFCQEDTVVNLAPIQDKKSGAVERVPPIEVFYSQSLINAKTVEVLKKGVLEFRVNHGFGDVAGDNGGIERFFGLDNASDVRIGFQLGLSDHLNVVAARAKGASIVQQLWELGLKYKFMSQDDKRPFSISAYANTVVSSMKASQAPNQENSFDDFSDRLSEVFQLLIARKIGKVSLQVSPTLVNRNFVTSGDDNTLFAIGGGARIPLSKKLVLIADYFHSFRSDESKAVYRSQGIELYDVFGVGLEILTEGHIFHLNFTNATETLENRFIPRTTTSWGKGQYRWAFTLSRNFTVFH